MIFGENQVIIYKQRVAFQLRKSGWKSARFLYDEEEVKRNETSQSDGSVMIKIIKQYN